MSIKLYDIVEDLSPRDKILSFLRATRKDRIVLTDTEKKYIEIIDYADDIMRAHPSFNEKQLCSMMVAKYDIGYTSARNYLHDAKYIHGTQQKTVKSYERILLTDFLKKVIDEAMNPTPIKDSTGEILRMPAERNLAAAIRAVEIISRINNLENFDDEENGKEEGSGTTIIRPAFNPEILGVELPENIDELISRLRKTSDTLRKAENMLNQGDGN